MNRSGKRPVLDRNKWLDVLVVLAVVLATFFVLDAVAGHAAGYSDIILTFVLAWLISFVLGPIVNFLAPGDVAVPGKRRLSRPLAVIVVYLALLALLVLAAALLVPPATDQLAKAAVALPELAGRLPELGAWLEARLRESKIDIDVGRTLEATLQSLRGPFEAAVGNALSLVSGLLGFLSTATFVLILSFIMTYDAPRIKRALLAFVPRSLWDEARFLSSSIDRTFGGFVRGQLIQATMILVATSAAMSLFRADYVLLASATAGLFMFIPLVGPFLAIVPPVLAVLFVSFETAIWLTVVLAVIQFLVINVVMPRILSDTLGLHPLIVFASILVGVRAGGFWGAFFGIPIAGVLWAMAEFFMERHRTEAGESGDMNKEG